MTATDPRDPEQIGHLMARLAWREQQATATLTPAEYRATALATVASAEAAHRGDRDTLEALAPTTIAELRCQAATALEMLGAVMAVTPGLAEAFRREFVTFEEEQ